MVLEPSALCVRNSFEIKVILLLISILLTFGDESAPSESEYMNKLTMSLFAPEKYDKKLSPGPQPVNLFSFMAVEHIDELNEEQETMKVYATMHFYWQDTRLAWDPSLFGEIKQITRTRKEFMSLWTPQIYFTQFSNRNEQFICFPYYASVMIDFRGNVIVQSAITLQTTCDFDFQNFPYDRQTCGITLYSRDSISRLTFATLSGMTIASMDYHLADGEQTSRRRTGEWEVTSSNGSVGYLTPMGQATTNISSLPREWTRSFVLFKLIFERRPVHFWHTVTLPIVGTSLLSLIVACLEDNKTSALLLLCCLLLYAPLVDDMMQQMPPAAGALPTIALFYVLALGGTFLAFIVRCIAVWWTTTAAENATITLTECEDENGCCQELGTLTGWRYDCLPADQCPGDDEVACGRHFDGSWCYCKNETDERCMPAQLRTKEHEIATVADIESSVPLQCYSGLQKWTFPPDDDSVSLVNCTATETCCYRLRSLKGISFKCSSDCPVDWSTNACSSVDEKDPQINWCFCKDSTDAHCAPLAFYADGNQTERV